MFVLAKSSLLSLALSRTLATLTKQKPKSKICLIGQLGHGKTTLAAAICKILSESGHLKYASSQEIDLMRESFSCQGYTFHQFKFETENKRYITFDFPSVHHFIYYLLQGGQKLDTGILVVSPSEGATLETLKAGQYAHYAKIQNLIIFMNQFRNVDDDEILKIAELETRLILRQNGYDPFNSKFIHGSALCTLKNIEPSIGQESIMKLIESIEAIPTNILDDRPLYMPIKKIISYTDKGTILIGRIEQGMIRPGDVLDVNGVGPIKKILVSQVEVFGKIVEIAKTGDIVRCISHDILVDESTYGQILSQPGTVSSFSKFKACIFFFGQAPHTSINDLTNTTFTVNHTIVPGKLTYPPNLSNLRINHNSQYVESYSRIDFLGSYDNNDNGDNKKIPLFDDDHDVVSGLSNCNYIQNDDTSQICPAKIELFVKNYRFLQECSIHGEFSFALPIREGAFFKFEQSDHIKGFGYITEIIK